MEYLQIQIQIFLDKKIYNSIALVCFNIFNLLNFKLLLIKKFMLMIIGIRKNLNMLEMLTIPMGK